MKTKTPEDYLREPYSRILIPEEEGGYSAEVLEFPGCFADGETAEEALMNLEEAARNWIEATIRQGRPIPEPAANAEYAGKVALRLPRSIHRKAVQMAAQDGVSLNTFLVEAVAERVGAKKLSGDVVSHVNQVIQEMEQRLTHQMAQHSRTLVLYLNSNRAGAKQVTIGGPGSTAIAGAGYRFRGAAPDSLIPSKNMPDLYELLATEPVG